MSTSPAPIARALLSVSDKSGLVAFAKGLAGYGVELISTGGTANALREAGLDVKDVSQITGFPEIMDGRVKTLHPNVHGGLLAVRGNEEHEKAKAAQGIRNIDLLVVNLYPFEATLAGGADFDTCIENIDIGGPAMIRAAAKNHADVTVVVDPSDYEKLLGDMAQHKGATCAKFRRKLAAKAFARTGAYDAAISNWFAAELELNAPVYRAFGGDLAQSLRYGENPHQSAAFYTDGDARPGVASARQLQGKELSYNNINDTDAAFELVSEFADSGKAAVAIIKHANPCGAALGDTLAQAYDRAFLCDPVSAFGGIVAVNQTLDAEIAAKIANVFTEVVIAPAIDEDAAKILSAKKNLRLLVTGGMADAGAKGLTFKSVSGGFLVQSRDNGRIGPEDVRIVTKRQPTEREMADLIFAFSIAKHVKSNAIVYVRDGATVGVGAGQMSRIDSARIAARKSEDAARAAGIAEPLVKGSVVASDAFFPFADGLLAAAEAGATAVIQPGGSMRDDEVIRAADEAGLAMVMTGMRHFRH